MFFLNDTDGKITYYNTFYVPLYVSTCLKYFCYDSNSVPGYCFLIVTNKTLLFITVHRMHIGVHNVHRHSQAREIVLFFIYQVIFFYYTTIVGSNIYCRMFVNFKFWRITLLCKFVFMYGFVDNNSYFLIQYLRFRVVCTIKTI